MVCFFSRKKSRKDWRISAEVIGSEVNVDCGQFSSGGRGRRPGVGFVRVDELFCAQTIRAMSDDLVGEMQRIYPQIYLACHVDHVRARSTEWRLSARDSSLLSHLDRDAGMRPKELAGHLNVAASTLSAAITRLVELGYIRSAATKTDKRRRQLCLTSLGAEAMAATSVLDGARVAALVKTFTAKERETVARGLHLLARAARQLQERS